MREPSAQGIVVTLLFSYPLSLLYLCLPFIVSCKPVTIMTANSASSVPGTVLWAWGTLSLQGGAAYPGATRTLLSLGALSSLGRPVTPSPVQQVLPALLSIIPPPPL